MYARPMIKAKIGSPSRGTARRARELADTARTLDERKSALPYGEFEKWALKAFPKYPIQVLRYLRKAHRVFGKDLARLLERLGQKKVFLLVGLDDPWEPLKDGISQPGARERTPLERLSVSQLRHLIRVRNNTESAGRDGWGTLGTTVARITTLWPRVQKQAPAVSLRRDTARKQLERLRALLSEAIGEVDTVLGGEDRPAPRRAERGGTTILRPASKPGSRRDAGFLD